MLVAHLGTGSGAAGEFHYAIEITFETRKDQTGFFVSLYFPEQYHKSVTDFGPFPTLDAALNTITLAAAGQYAPMMKAVYATYGVRLSREIFRDVYGPIRASGAQWVIMPDTALIARFEQEVAESVAVR
jgi:hypothetical protein